MKEYRLGTVRKKVGLRRSKRKSLSFYISLRHSARAEWLEWWKGWLHWSGAFPLRSACGEGERGERGEREREREIIAYYNIAYCSLVSYSIV